MRTWAERLEALTSTGNFQITIDVQQSYGGKIVGVSVDEDDGYGAPIPVAGNSGYTLEAAMTAVVEEWEKKRDLLRGRADGGAA